VLTSFPLVLRSPHVTKITGPSDNSGRFCRIPQGRFAGLVLCLVGCWMDWGECLSRQACGSTCQTESAIVYLQSFDLGGFLPPARGFSLPESWIAHNGAKLMSVGGVSNSGGLLGEYLLAQQEEDNSTGSPPNPSGPSIFGLLWPIIAIFFLFWLLLIRPQQKERAKIQQMLANLKKNDRVITIGGIYGVVTNVRREADEVTIKVDDAANVKLKVTLGAIARVLGEEPEADRASAFKDGKTD